MFIHSQYAWNIDGRKVSYPTLPVPKICHGFHWQRCMGSRFERGMQDGDGTVGGRFNKYSRQAPPQYTFQTDSIPGTGEHQYLLLILLIISTKLHKNLITGITISITIVLLSNIYLIIITININNNNKNSRQNYPVPVSVRRYNVPVQ